MSSPATRGERMGCQRDICLCPDCIRQATASEVEVGERAKLAIAALAAKCKDRSRARVVEARGAR